MSDYIFASEGGTTQIYWNKIIDPLMLSLIGELSADVR